MEGETPKKSLQLRLPDSLNQKFNAVGDVAGGLLAQGTELLQQGAATGKELALKAVEKSQAAVGSVQRRLGEDYYAILKENPLIQETLLRQQRNPDLLATAFNIPWTSTLLWSAAAGSIVSLEQPINIFLQGLIHDGPGHWRRWKEVNQFMDNVSGQFMAGATDAGQQFKFGWFSFGFSRPRLSRATGAGHRLKFGHSIEHLPQIVERFGIESTPAFFVHLLQDAATVDGIPVVPYAWDVKSALQAAGVPRKVATGLVSVNYSGLLAAMSIVGVVGVIWEMGSAAVKKAKTQGYLKTAADAFQNNDYLATIENYQRALEVERNSLVLMALGQVYMRRAANRLRAHQAFIEAVKGLAEQPGATVPYYHAKISVRGLAGLQALATADVLADIHPEHWNDHVQDLVNATVFSFSEAAIAQAKESEGIMADKVFAPAHFSAAINYYLAAKAASYCPFVEEQRDKVIRNAQEALRLLGLVAQYDENELRQPASKIRELWEHELYSPAELAMLLTNVEHQTLNHPR